MEPLEHWKIVRAEIHAEHELISHRMSWYLASQSFLITAFAISGSQGHNFEWLATWFLPALGISISALIWAGVLAALAAMSRLRAESSRLTRENRELECLAFDKNAHAIRPAGMASAVLLPPIFIVAWILCAKYARF